MESTTGVGDKATKEHEMMNYAVWLQDKRKKTPYFRLISAEGLNNAKMIAKDLAWRAKVEWIGVSPHDSLSCNLI